MDNPKKCVICKKMFNTDRPKRKYKICSKCGDLRVYGNVKLYTILVKAFGLQKEADNGTD